MTKVGNVALKTICNPVKTPDAAPTSAQEQNNIKTDSLIYSETPAYQINWVEGQDAECLSEEDRAAALIKRGIDLYQNGDYNRAIETFKQYLNEYETLIISHTLPADQGNSDFGPLAVRYYLGNAYLEIGDQDKAIENFQLIVENENYLPSIYSYESHFRLVEAYAKQGETEKVRQEFESIKSYSRGRDDLMDRLEQIFLDPRFSARKSQVIYSSRTFEIRKFSGQEDYYLIYTKKFPVNSIFSGFQGKFLGIAYRQEEGEMIIFQESNGITIYLSAEKTDSGLKKELNSLPDGFTSGLQAIYYSGRLPKSVRDDAAGLYFPDLKQIKLYGDGKGFLIHEIFHHWGMNAGQEQVCLLNEIGWPSDRPLDPNDFTKKYGMENKLEYFATWGEAYVAGSLGDNSGRSARQYIREQMERGNFDPAAAYLFIRYLTPMKGREYQLNKNNPSLGFAEVKRRWLDWQINDPQTLEMQTNKNTINIIDEMEEQAKQLGLDE